MVTLNQAADEFLAQRRIAAAGVSRTDSGHGANVVYKGLRSAGYEVFAVNPNAEEVEGDPCFHDVKSIPGGVDAVVVGTAPPASARAVPPPAEAADLCRQNGITVIAGACPMMFLPGADFGHRCMRWVLGLTGGLPKEA